MLKLLLATNNPGKILEIRAILSSPDIILLAPSDIGLNLEVGEDGQSYAENASKKALAFAQASGLLSLADDSGLEVNALGGKPGLHSNRFGPQPSTAASRRRYLLEQLQGKPRPWTARFRSTVAIVAPGGEVQLATGECEGEIAPEERGTGGFGYDPIFLVSALGKTMAELGIREKNCLSHRARALMNARPILEKYLEDSR